LLCTAIVGGAVIPLVVGAVADRTGIHGAFALLVICYFYILYYGARGSRHPARTPAPSFSPSINPAPRGASAARL
jgi:FHS family L-fucose permease-like MFS transporter